MVNPTKHFSVCSIIPDSRSLYLFQVFNTFQLMEHTNYELTWTIFNTHLVVDHTWILGVASKQQLRLLHDRVRDSTTVVNSLSPQMSELVKDAIASWCGDIVGHFWQIKNGVEKLDELRFEFFNFNTFDDSDILATSCTSVAQIQLLHSLEGTVLGFCLLDTE